MQYKIKGEYTDIKDATIEKTGHSNEFSMRDIERENEQVDKIVRELQGQIKLEIAKLTNIEENHAIVKTLDDKDLFACAMYGESKLLKIKSEEKLKSIEEHKEKNLEEIEIIKLQIPELNVIESPEEVIPNA